MDSSTPTTKNDDVQSIDGNLGIEKKYKNYEHLNLIKNRNTYSEREKERRVLVFEKETYRRNKNKVGILVKKNSKKIPLIDTKSEFFEIYEHNLIHARLMECQLCGNIAQDQRSLRCGHSFCIQCLESRLEVKDGYSRVSA